MAIGTRYWEINQKEAAIVRLIFRMYLDGSSQRAIVRHLNDHYHRTKMGREWSQGQISRTLNRPFYVGRTRNTKGEIVESDGYYDCGMIPGCKQEGMIVPSVLVVFPV